MVSTLVLLSVLQSAIQGVAFCCRRRLVLLNTGLALVAIFRTNEEWNPVYKIFYRVRFCGNDPITE